MKPPLNELEQAGAFENLRLYPVKAEFIPEKKKPFWQENFTVLISLVMIIAAYFFQFNFGEESLLAMLLFLGAITARFH